MGKRQRRKDALAERAAVYWEQFERMRPIKVCNCCLPYEQCCGAPKVPTKTTTTTNAEAE